MTKLYLSALCSLTLWCAVSEVVLAQDLASTESPPPLTAPPLPQTTAHGRFHLQAPDSSWADLLREHIPEFSTTSEAQNQTPSLLRRLRSDISGILATEGYFSPQITIDTSALRVAGSSESNLTVEVKAGPRTVIENVTININGPLRSAIDAAEAKALERQHGLLMDWSLAVGDPFREEDWSSSKNQLTDSLRADVYAAAKISSSAAKIDADQNSAALSLEVDSGPAFTLGSLRVNGLQRYPASLLERFRPPQRGESYSRSRLLDFQRALQNSAYFSTVTVAIDPDPEQAAEVPIDVTLQERKPRDLSFGLGYSTNTGFRSEVAYRDRNILQQAWDLRSAVRIEQRRQLGYIDIYLPPDDNRVDSFGVIVDRENVSGVQTTRNALGVKRTTTRGRIEQRLGMNLLREKSTAEGQLEDSSKAFVLTAGWTWRDVDDTFAPRRGEIYQFDLALSEKAVFSDQSFLRTYAKYQRWVPVGKSDNLIFRLEAGQVFANSEHGIPQDYLFRTGGSTSVRGYAYQSLGIVQGVAVTGGRVMSAASAEYVHWLNQSWGVASFVDVGDAADSWRALSLRQAIGVGGRYRTPAGPIALDLAYGRQTAKLRLDFSIAIAF
ncbi:MULTISPECIES: autotransporter assembly complex protein TamA [unclassified Undibacterium]|uniref:autotransporter assembly complex protein TamA n=1 Tax=unclassified Undibacterium TaxID=2630295 RepID=UPI002AC9A052|nr:MULTISPECIES: BamA/TamA family outer membrane protein [unclassified Undibacterium]MEB0137698.1 BamA/TamA family outer membrane protein [Undibacterium sp. CCC2.1]MEB0172650.1 BamA/TamA family outer membrane protein [Undibacterium sp. CCC1.1]MEB0177583.1 BamA/TamA family outer membrane protein [Undibacterium sp. CCC3.4]MEB0215445.1 BamA/TamA family outer membrane protein [Undibacterium sp. 5I2]WPX42272.1 BamA/TamA family outer membrane protein [Undibacterium sp. CCC3.4]